MKGDAGSAPAWLGATGGHRSSTVQPEWQPWAGARGVLWAITPMVLIAALLPPLLATGISLAFIGCAAVSWISSKTAVDPWLCRVLAPYAMIAFVGMLVGVGADPYLYAKDGWYVTNAPMLIAVGYILYWIKPDIAVAMKAFVLAGVALGIVYLSHFVLHPALLGLPAADLRRYAGTGYYAPALGLMILAAYHGHWASALQMPRWVGWLAFGVCALAMTLMFSRTLLLVAVIGALAAGGFFARRELLRLGVAAGIALGLVLAVQSLMPSDVKRDSFGGKLAYAFEEMFESQYTDRDNIYAHWRAYETSRAISTVQAASPHVWLVGSGFGATLDLGIAAPLGDGLYGKSELMRSIPVFHNGYIYLLIKGGLLAVGLYLLSLAWLYLAARSDAAASDRVAAAPARILQGVVLSLAITTAVTSGSFNKSDMYAFLLAAGFLLAVVSGRRRFLRAGGGLILGAAMPSSASADTPRRHPPSAFNSGLVKGFAIGRVGARTDADLTAMQQMGARFARVFVPFTQTDAGFQITDDSINRMRHLLDWARPRGVTIIVAAEVPGVAAAPFWSNQALKASFVAAWRRFAEVFGNDPAIAGLDLMNEPSPPWPSGDVAEAHGHWRPLAEQTILALRAEGCALPVIFEEIGGAGFPVGLKDFKPFADRNVVYSFHHYSPHDITHQRVSDTWPRTVPYPCGAEYNLGFYDEKYGIGPWNKRRMELELRHVIQFQRRYKVPILVGEFSCVRWAPAGTRERYLSDALSLYRRYGWHWLYHEFRGWPGWDAEITSTDMNVTVREANSPVMNLILNEMRTP